MAATIRHSRPPKCEGILLALRPTQHSRGHLARRSNAVHAICIWSTSGNCDRTPNQTSIQFSFIFVRLQNALKAKRLGIAEIVDFTKLSSSEVETELKLKLLKVLEDPKYAIASKQLSQSFRDQKEAPLERALWHIEWAMRNPSPDYLNSPSLKLGHIAANNYDVVALFTIVAALMVAAVGKLLSRIFTRRPTNLTKKNN